MARREVNVFSLSFLDAMTCGLGAVILLYMIINANVSLRTNQLTEDLQAEASRLETEVLAGQENLVEVRNSVEQTEKKRVVTHGLARRLIEALEALQVELATFEDTTIARKEHINKLKADLKSLEEGSKRLSGGIQSEETPGSRERAFIGDGDRQYLTGLKVGGKRILFLVDTSASMLGEHIVDIVVRRNLPAARKVEAAKWRQAVATVDWLTTQMPKGSQFQIYTFNETAQPVLAETTGQWLDTAEPGRVSNAVQALRETVPDKGTNLYRAFTAISAMSPPPDNLTLVVDGLPTQGRNPPRGGTVSARQRLKLFRRAIEQLSGRIPLNVVLLPMEGDPQAASAYWALAMRSRGSFFTPSEDWP